MDTILNICFEENYFKMPRRKGKRGIFKTDIPTTNRHKYKEIVEPILEMERITKSGIVNLPCHPSHMVNLRSTMINEDGSLHHIFAKQAGQMMPNGFMREWLKLFVLMHRKHIAKKASSYLDSKGLTIELWADGIRDGRKGDMLVLYTLNLLLETHMVVHLKDGHTWSMLAEAGPSHSDDLDHSELHLAYTGQGLFIELIECTIPLKIVESTDKTTSIIIGELTTTEEKAIDEVVKLGLGVGISCERPQIKTGTMVLKSRTQRKPSASAGSAQDLPRVQQELNEEQEKDIKQVISKNVDEETVISKEKMECKVYIKRLRMTPYSSIEVTPDMVSQYPLSKYQPLGYYSDLNSQDMGDPDKLSVYSDSTEAYWPLVQQPTKCTRAMQVLRPAHLKSARFDILVHGIH